VKRILSIGFIRKSDKIKLLFGIKNNKKKGGGITFQIFNELNIKKMGK
jgi:hypothetical protein